LQYQDSFQDVGPARQGLLHLNHAPGLLLVFFFLKIGLAHFAYTGLELVILLSLPPE
jgi:hypothetical protein